MDTFSYLTQLKTRLATCPVIVFVIIVQEWVTVDQGYFRARLQLSNDDFLEVAEYFVLQEDRCLPKRYRYQWMDKSQHVLRKRWDNVEHFPHLPGFPYHIHDGKESNVIPGKPISILELIDLIEEEIG